MQSFATLLVFLCFSPRARGVHVDEGFLDVLHLSGGEIAKRVVLRAEVFHESHKFVVLHFQLLLVNRPLSALSSRFHFARLPSLHRLDHGFDELLLGLGEAVLGVELRVDLPREASRVRMVLVT